MIKPVLIPIANNIYQAGSTGYAQDLGLTRIFHKSEAFICKAFRGAAVVCYRKSLITQQMKASDLPEG